MDKRIEIYNRIKKIASGLDDGEILTRADLSYELKCFGIDSDSIETSRLIYEAYRYFKDDAIKFAFVGNDRKHYVVDAFKVCFSVEANDCKSLGVAVSEHIHDGNRSLCSLKENVKNISEAVNCTSGSSDFMSYLTGTYGAENIHASAKKAYGKYSELVSSYDSAVDAIKSAMTDFVFLREQVGMVFRKYSMALVDVFGDSIKVIDPEIFDFKSVEYLDTCSMLDAVSLEYDMLSKSCSMLIEDISEGFAASVKKSAAVFRDSGNRKVGAALAVLNLVGHYIDTSTRTTALKQEYIRFADKIKKDAYAINGDLGRLTVIYHTLSELYMPKAEVFYRYASEILTEEFEKMLGSVYSDDSLKELQQKRDSILDDCVGLRKSVADERINIGIYRANIASNKQLLDSSKDNYREAVSLRPKKPFFLFNLLTFGALKKQYNRNLSEWYDKYSYSVKYYENLLVDVKMDQDELNRISADLSVNEKKLREYETELSKIANDLKSNLAVSKEEKSKVLEHLEPVLKLLSFAKDILSSRLDEKYIKTVEFSKPESLELSDDVNKRLKDFSENLKNEINSAVSGNADERFFGGTLTENEASSMDVPVHDTVNKVVDLMEECIRLNEMQRLSKVSDDEFAAKLHSLHSEFRNDIDIVSSKAEIIRQSLIKLNTAADREQLKEALALLSGIDDEMMSIEDFDRFLKGEINITV